MSKPYCKKVLVLATANAKDFVHTLGRNVGFTGRIAVFEGNTLTGENPNIVPQRLRAARAESVEVKSI